MTDFERLAELERERRSFAVATVVARRSPVSSHVGDHALVFPDGAMEGFVGGSCSRDIVRREALRALRTGLPRLVQIRPGGGEERERASGECIVVAMGCASEGAVDVYVEPHLPLPRLIVVGDTPVAGALARVAAQVGYDVVRVVLEAERAAIEPLHGIRTIALETFATHLAQRGADARSELVAVVASQGHYDEAALEPLLAAEPAFVGLLASRRRAQAVFATLAQHGVSAQRVARVRTPVGLDIGARSPGEVAISILAEIVARVPRPAIAEETRSSAHDPVCGMEVDPDSARHTLEREGRRYVFCSTGCRARYATELERSLTAGGT
ncbi:MAG TPA: XdhC family protein [Candidatus Acidoferrum sp.]|nr:XdhC family protein [Candidatus Acidoferrum sp.]